ncbi:C40 family peptidase [Sphaerimonospora sp. CA-214678]|uniref:C40 family peptidase n=1 Tax=Sphaerimonospora sp. CA-214678 TaxID=3240029 RepID=UPI003D950067
MIAEVGIGKLIATGGGLVCSIVVIAGLSGGAKYALTAADATKLRSAICAYATSPGAVRKAPAARFGLSAEQMANAREIVNVAAELRLPKRAAEIALATAIQESSLTNLTRGDSSYGLFQQQPSQGWGTKRQVTDPSHAARSFYSRLIEIPGRASMPLTKAAALVQRPREDLRDAYAKHEPLAKALVALLWRGKPAKRTAVDTATSDDVRVRIQAAAGLGVPRDAVVAGLAADLADQDSGEQPDPDEITKRADAIVTTVAGQLCKELKPKLSDPVDETSSDGSAPVVLPSGRGAIAVRAALRMIGVRYSFSGAPAGGAEFILRACAAQPADNEQSRSATGERSPAGRVGSRCRVVANVVGFALAQTGKPYRWGAAGPSSFDCSGLAMKAYAAAGVRIPRTTFEQWPFGVRVPAGQEQPGDLVFFNSGPGSSPGRPGHVGIVVGDGKMVEARCTRCGPITVASYRSGRPVVGFTRPWATASAR